MVMMTSDDDDDDDDGDVDNDDDDEISFFWHNLKRNNKRTVQNSQHQYRLHQARLKMDCSKNPLPCQTLNLMTKT